MKGRRLVILASILCKWLTGCGTMDYGNEISQVIYTSDAGTLLPEQQWHERVVISRSKVSLARNGRVEHTEINEGAWEFSVEEQQVQALFEQIRTVDCSSLERIEPDDPPDGGGTETYTIRYANGKECSLVYDSGTTYTKGLLIVHPIQAFLTNLTPPAEAVNRYRFSP